MGELLALLPSSPLLSRDSSDLASAVLCLSAMVVLALASLPKLGNSNLTALQRPKWPPGTSPRNPNNSYKNVIIINIYSSFLS